MVYLGGVHKILYKQGPFIAKITCYYFLPINAPEPMSLKTLTRKQISFSQDTGSSRICLVDEMFTKAGEFQ